MEAKIMRRAHGTAAGLFFLCLAGLLALTACGGGGSGGGGNGGGGQDHISVSIAPATSVTIDYAQATLLIVAVTGDSKNGGVTWSLSGPGGLALQTARSITYASPIINGPAADATVTATSVNDPSKSASIVIHIMPLPTIGTAQPPAGTNGTAYSFQIPVTGGTGALTWSISLGALPNGLTLDQTGKISGTPNADLRLPYIFAVKVQDTLGGSGTSDYALWVNNPPPPVIAAATLPVGTNGVAYPGFAFTVASGGLGPFSWSATGLPTGMSLSSTGQLSGTTTQEGTFPITVSVQDHSNPAQTASQNLSLTINPPPIVVTITNKFSISNAGGVAITLNARVDNDRDPNQPGVVWTLTANGVDCSAPPAPNPPSDCGSFTNETATSVTYTPPLTVPELPYSAPVITATSVNDPSKADSDHFAIVVSASCSAGSGNEAMLSGKYAFSLNGHNQNGFLGVLGSFTADGAGHIINGEIDSDGSFGVKHEDLDRTVSSYSVSSDNRGCANFVTSFGNFSVRFALNSVPSSISTKGRIIEWEMGSRAYIASGLILKQDENAFGGGLVGRYMAVSSGTNASNKRFGSLATFTAQNGQFLDITNDTNDDGSASHGSGGTPGTYANFDSNGRSEGTLGVDSPITMYMVSRARVLHISRGATGSRVSNGEIRQQLGTSPGLTWLSSPAILHMTGVATASGGGQHISLGTFTGDNTGNVASSITEYDAGDAPSTVGQNCTYSVDGNGIGTPVGSTCPGAPILYLTDQNTGFLLGTSADHKVMVGEMEAQTGGPFSNTTNIGTYFGGTEALTTQDATTKVSQTILGAGAYTGTADESSVGSQNVIAGIADTYTITSNGNFALNGPSVENGFAVSGSKWIVVDTTNPLFPALIVNEK